MNNQEPAWKNFVQSVTPELAEEWLRLHANPRNRKVKVSDSRVQSWAREQRAGAWKINPFAPIGFATGGMLLNGHNRLTAQTVSRVTCGYVVFYDVPEEVLRVTDTGKPRTHQQIARMFGDETDMHSAYKVIEIVRQKNAETMVYLGQSDLERYADEFESIPSETVGLLLSIRVGRQRLRAGIVAGFLLLLRDLTTRQTATQMIADLDAVAKREAVGRKATRNLITWIENATGEHARLASESVSVVVAAHRQYVQNKDLQFVKYNLENLAPYQSGGVERLRLPVAAE